MKKNIISIVVMVICFGVSQARAVTVPLVQDAFWSGGFAPGVAALTDSMCSDYVSLASSTTCTNYIGTAIPPYDETQAQAALKFTLPQSSSVLSTAKLYLKVMDLIGSPTATITLTDDNNWQQTNDSATSKFPTLSNATVILTNGSVSSAGWVSLTLATSALDTKVVSSGTTDATLIITGSTTASTYFNFVADDDASGDKAYLVLTFKPQVQSISVPSNATYITGDALDFTVAFDSNVLVTGIPKLPLILNTGGTVQASYVSGSGTPNLVFRYTVTSGNLDADGVTMGSTLALNGGTIRNLDSDNAELTLYNVAATTGVKVDGVAPAVSSVSVPTNATYTTGQNLDFTVNFSETVAVTGSDSTLGLAIGSTVRQAAYQTKTATGITYCYAIQSGDIDTDGVTVGTLTLNTSTIKDGAGNNATLTLNAVGDTSLVLVASLPLAVTATAATAVTFTGFTANWNSVSGATGYYLDVATNSGFTSFATGYTNKNVGNVTSMSVTGLTSATAYYYRVRAYNGGGTSTDSNTITATTVTTRVVTVTTDSGAGSLRQAITDANSGDAITFDSGLTGLTITLASPLVISKDLTISGPEAANLTISGNGALQPFQVTGATTFTLQNLTIANGSGTNGGALADNAGATTTITGCAFTGNSATANGGAINTVGAMTISDTLFSANSATSNGGGISSSGTLTLTNVTLNGNSAANGGGIHNSVGTTTIVNATIAGNNATAQGGGIDIASGTVNLKNSIIANNTSPSGPDIKGIVTSQDYNLIKATTDATINGTTTNNVSSDPLLGTLANNGGPTKTMALLFGSPAIDKGNCASGPAADQRGMTRPQNTTCDMGAYERAVPAALTATGGTPQSALPNAAFATALTAKVADSLGGVLDGISVAFAGPGSGAGITATGEATSNTSGIASFTATANGTEGAYAVTATFNGLTANYSLTNGKQAQTIGAISFTPATLNVGGTTIVSATATSGLAVSFSSTTPAVCTISGSTVTGVTAGTCAIAANQAGNGSYNAATQVTGSITFSIPPKTSQTIGAVIFNPQSLTVGGTATVNATATSGLAVSFSSTTPAVCTISGSTVTGVTAGTCTIAANQAGNTTYNAATPVTQSFAVNKNPQIISAISFNPPSITVGGSATVTATATSGLTATFSSVTPAVCTISGNTVTGVTAGACAIAVSQAGNDSYNAAPTVVSQSLTVASAITPLPLAISALSNNAVTTETTQNISGMVSDRANLQTLTINGGIVTVNTDGSFSYPVQLVAGPNTIVVIATSTAGVTTSDSRTITLDSTAPKLTVSYPPDNGIAIQQVITFTGTIAELLSSTGKTIAKTTALGTTPVVSYTVNGSTPQAASQTDTSYTFITTLGTGMNTVRVFATTTAGQTVEAKRTVTYQPAFSLAVTDPATDVHLALDSYLLKGSITDNTTPVTVTITMDGQSYTPTVTGGVFQQQLNFTADKTCQISVTGLDQNNNSLTVQRNIIHAAAVSSFTIADALQALQMSVGIATPTSAQILRMDVAPMVNGVSVGDGKVDIEDAMVILRMAVGLIP